MIEVGITVACICVVSAFAAATTAVLAFYAMRWLISRDEVFEFALAFAVGFVAAVALTSCAHVEPVHGPHWWNCANRVCNSDSRVATVLGAAYDANAKTCECYVDDVRHLRQWIEVKP